MDIHEQLLITQPDDQIDGSIHFDDLDIPFRDSDDLEVIVQQTTLAIRSACPLSSSNLCRAVVSARRGQTLDKVDFYCDSTRCQRLVAG